MTEKFGEVRSFAGNETFLMGARDLGVGTLDAVSELVDNSLDADAENIHIKIENRDDGNLRIYVEDDGRGMEQTIEDDGREYDGLTYNLSFGSRPENRDVEIGKFGWGLSMSATCQANLTRIWTTRDGEDGWRFTEIDLEKMDEENETKPPESEYKPLDGHLDLEDPDKDHGTVVVFEEVDRADYSRAGDARNALIKNLARRYRYYLRGGRKITVNGTEVEPFDPLYRWEDARNPHDIPTVDDLYYEDSFEIQGYEDDDDEMHEVKVRVVWLDVEEIRAKDEWSGSWMGKAGLTQENQGFYLLRNGREIGAGESFNGFFKRHSDKNYFRAEIDFPAELDDYFGITTNKSKYSLKYEMQDRLEESVGGIPEQIHQKTRDLIDSLKAEAEKESRDKEQTLSEEIAEDGDKLLKSRDRLDDEEEEEVEEEIQEEKQQRIQEVEEDENLDEEEKEEIVEDIEQEYEGYLEYPFKVTYDSLASGQFYEVEKKGKQTRVVLNDGHEFYDIYERATQESGERLILDLLLLSAAHAEEYYRDKDEMMRFLNEFRHEWSTALRVFLDQRPSTTDETVKNLTDPLSDD